MQKIFEVIGTVLGVLVSLMGAIESPGDGAAKKAEVVAGLKKVVGTLGLPAWAVGAFSNDAVLDLLVDFLVKSLNKTGWFAANPT